MEASEFKPGIYQHYKGGFYIALFLVSHHENGELFVVYISTDHKTTKIREYATPGKDSWTDQMSIPYSGTNSDRIVPRFRYIGPSA